MTENAYKFQIPSHHKSIIKVIGVGGGGSNAVNHMYNQGIKDVEFVVCNTDAQALKASPVPNKLQIGVNLTSGLGAGANPQKGKEAAMESKEDIRDLLGDGTKMVFVTAGMGGGTGTGAAPVIAKVARDMDILTVGIVTSPFRFEGRKKVLQAEQGIRELRESCDTVLVILNDKLGEIFGNLEITNAFAQADNVLTTAAKGIAEIITVPGYVNVDFEDVKTVMKNAGAAVMGSSTTEGENRALRAAELALASPLLNDTDITGAEKILLSIVSGDKAELKMNELTEITDYIQDKAGDYAEVIFGHGVDAEMGNSISVTVIATGFDKPNKDEEMTHSQDYQEPQRRVIDLESNRQINLFDKLDNSTQNFRKEEEPKVPKEEPVNRNKENASRGYGFLGGAVNQNQPKPDPNENFHEEAPMDEWDEALEQEFTVIQKEPEPPSLVNKWEERRREMQQRSDERIAKLKNLKTGYDNNIGEFKEMLEVPAYKRKNVKLNDVPHSSEKNISKFNLNDDNQILGNNKFLHDNVD